MKKTHKLATFELIAYIISGILMVWGIVLIGLGLAEQFVSHQSEFYAACMTYASLFGLHFLGWGLIILAIGAVLAIIVLCVYARNKDRVFEKEQRRAARLAKTTTETTVDQVVDAVVEEKK